MKKKEFESELIVINVRSKMESVILDLRFTKPRFKEPSKQQLENIIQPIPKSEMEKWGERWQRDTRRLCGSSFNNK
jgi:hypothetical protein